MIRQSFSWWCFRNRGVEDDALLRAAARIGYAAVELMPADLFDPARDHGLAIACHGAHASIASGLNDPAQHDRIADEVERSLDLAVRYAIPSLIVMAGNRRSDVTDAEAAVHTAECLRRLAPLAESAGVDLVMELLNSKVDHPGYQFDHAAWGVGVCEAVGSPRVKILYDIYHAQIMEGDLIRTIRAHHAHFGHYHLAGNPGRGLPDESQEIHYSAVLRAIAETGYTGYFGQEFLPPGDPIAALRTAFERCCLSSV